MGLNLVILCCNRIDCILDPGPATEPGHGIRMGLKPKETFFDFVTDGFQRVEDPVGALFLPQLMPQKFHRIQFRGIGWQGIRLTLSGT